MRRVRADFGFSLVELMVVVTIIAVVSALVLPSVVQGIRERHAQHAAISVLDIARETRSRAMYRGVAQALVIESVSGTLRFHSYEGTNSSCRLSRFGGGLFDPTRRVYSLDLGAPAFTRDGIVGQLTVPSGISFLEICYTPLGVAFFSTSPIADGTAPSAVWSNASASDGGVLPLVGSGGAFVVDVYQSSGRGVRRRVVIPLSGTPRMRT